MESTRRLAPPRPSPQHHVPPTAIKRPCNHLVKSSSPSWTITRSISMLACLALCLNQRAHSVIMPLPKTSQLSESPADLRLSQYHFIKSQGEDMPYQLTINQLDSVSVRVMSNSCITINLNRAVPEDIDVRVSVNSGPNMITFDTANNTSHVSLATPPPPPPTTTTTGIAANNKPNEIIIHYTANTFGDRQIPFRTNQLAGHAEIVCRIVKQPKTKQIVIDDQKAFISVNIYRSWNLNVIIQIVGWIYFFAWSTSFYFQLMLNYRRKSVVGLNFDFLTLNLLGFTCYSIYNFTLMFSYTVQTEYYKRYTYSRIPVEYNDLLFSVHAFAITLVTVVQCFIYERGEQQISLPAGIFVSLAPALGLGLFIASLLRSVSVLDVVLYLSYVKLVITTIKYTPQAYMNYKRRATTGWSIHNIILDFTGGSFSILQMLLLAYNYDDWISIFGNFTKFGLGLVSMLFDILFFLQHYVFYRSDRRVSLVTNGTDLENSSESCPSPVISQSIRSANQNQSTLQQQQQQQQQQVGSADTGNIPSGENESNVEENSDTDRE